VGYLRSGDGGGIKKEFSAVKISVCGLGASGSNGLCSAVGIFCD
jgi:hypothetical protein